MKANEVSAKTCICLKRIKKISRTIKILFLLYFVLVTLFLFFTRHDVGTWTVYNTAYASLSDVPIVAKLIGGISIGIFLAAVATGYHLLNLYEKGIIFAANNVRLIGRIGHLALAYGLVDVCAPTLISGRFSVLPSLIAATGSSWVLGGLFVIVVSLIMDEGRKIQEEQELTV